MWSDEDVRRWARIRTIDLVSTGIRSGRPHRVEIWWFHFEGRFLITGTPGPRDWYANVLADPRVIVKVGGVDVECLATPVDDLEFRRRFFEQRESAWYSSMAELDALVHTSPMVAIEPRPGL